MLLPSVHLPNTYLLSSYSMPGIWLKIRSTKAVTQTSQGLWPHRAYNSVGKIAMPTVICDDDFCDEENIGCRWSSFVWLTMASWSKKHLSSYLNSEFSLTKTKRIVIPETLPFSMDGDVQYLHVYCFGWMLPQLISFSKSFSKLGSNLFMLLV